MKDGKSLESKVNSLSNTLRLYDSRTAKSGYIPAQPADFVIPKYFIECKSTGKLYFSKSNFSKSQIAMQMFWFQQVGVETFYILEFGNYNTYKVPFTFIYSFFSSKQGKLYEHDLKSDWKIDKEVFNEKGLFQR